MDPHYRTEKMKQRLYETESEAEKIKQRARKSERAAHKNPELGTISDVRSCHVDEIDNVLQSQPLDNRKLNFIPLYCFKPPWMKSI